MKIESGQYAAQRTLYFATANPLLRASPMIYKAVRSGHNEKPLCGIRQIVSFGSTLLQKGCDGFWLDDAALLVNKVVGLQGSCLLLLQRIELKDNCVGL